MSSETFSVNSLSALKAPTPIITMLYSVKNGHIFKTSTPKKKFNTVHNLISFSMVFITKASRGVLLYWVKILCTDITRSLAMKLLCIPPFLKLDYQNCIRHHLLSVEARRTNGRVTKSGLWIRIKIARIRIRPC